MSHPLRKEKHGTAQDRHVTGDCAKPRMQAAGPVPVPSRTLTTRTRGESGDEIRVSIRSYGDLVEARKQGREMAAGIGFPAIDCTLITTAISELARNIVRHAGQGEICLSRDERLGFTGIVITASDRGPGIRDVRSAIQEGYSTSHGLGLGLPGVKRIMDDFDIQSKPRQGATVTVKKWKAK